MTDEEKNKFLADFFKEIKTQDNRCTATPVLFQIRDKKRIWGVEEDHADETVVMHCDGEHWVDREEEALIKEIVEREALDEAGENELRNEELLQYELVERLTDKGDWFESSYVDQWEYIPGQFYFTLKGAEAHLECNKHNYSDDVQIYVTHAFRNKEIENVLEALKEAGAAIKTIKERKS